MNDTLAFIGLVIALVTIFALVYLTRPIAPGSARDAQRRNRR